MQPMGVARPMRRSTESEYQLNGGINTAILHLEPSTRISRRLLRFSAERHPPKFAAMFRDKISAKAVLVAFAFYFLTANAAFAVVFHFWMPFGMNAQELARLAETDPTLVLWQRILGISLAIVTGYLACRLSGRNGLRNSIVVGALLILYGVLSIFMHPSDAPSRQIAKLLTPIPVALLGGWMCLRTSPRAKPKANQA